MSFGKGSSQRKHKTKAYAQPRLMRIAIIAVIIVSPSGGFFAKPNGPALSAVALIVANAKSKHRAAIVLQWAGDLKILRSKSNFLK